MQAWDDTSTIYFELRSLTKGEPVPYIAHSTTATWREMIRSIERDACIPTQMTPGNGAPAIII